MRPSPHTPPTLPSHAAPADAAPRLVRGDTDADGPCTLLDGAWVAAVLAVPANWRGLQADLAATPGDAATCWNLESLDRFDHVGAQLLWNHWGRAWPPQLRMLPQHQRLLERVASLTQPAPVATPVTWAERVDALGARVVRVGQQARGGVRLVGQLALDTARLVRRPHEAPWRDLSGHLYRMGATAMPITALVGFLIGVVLAYLTSLQLRQFGAQSFIVNILGVSLIRELGPMLAAILVAGRSGSAITAQIGVMRVTEELDAMRVMGIAHGFRLVLPRALALAIAMPLISVWTTLAALAGGMLAADLAMDITPAYFLSALPMAVKASTLTLAIFKSLVFGVLIALVGCHYGLRVKPNTQSLGEGTTAAVVTSITAVIVVDALFAIAFKNIGL